MTATAFPPATGGLGDESLQSVISSGLRAVFQPIVTLAEAGVVGYEALVRGPAGSTLELPHALFGQAEAQGLRGIGREIKVFLEVTERALTLDPAGLLSAVEQLRGDGFGFALDDVGADRRSLALLPLLRPDVVKLDVSLIQDHPSRASGEAMNGVCAYAEATGAAVLAEGVEHERHVLAAQSLGATLAQRWHFGSPSALPIGSQIKRSTAMLGIAPRVVPHSPAQLVFAQRGLRLGRKDVLLSVPRALEAQGSDLGEHAVVVANFQDVRHFTPTTRARFGQLAERVAFVAALGAGMPDPPAPAVRGANLADDDVLLGEWDLTVLGPHFAAALVARDLGDAGPDHDRRFAFVLTFDRNLVIEVAAALIAHVTGRRR